MEVKSRPNTVLVMAVPQPVMCLRTRFDTARPQYSTVDGMRERRYDNTRVEQVGGDVDAVLLPIEWVDCVPAPQRQYPWQMYCHSVPLDWSHLPSTALLTIV